MKKLLIVAILAFTFSFSYAQEKYIFNQNFLNPSTFNPGANGFDGTHNILFNYRNTWAGLPGAPKTFAFHYNGPVADRLGMGVYVVNDNFANLNTLKGQLNFAYKIEAETYKISAGLSTEYMQYRLKNVDLNSQLIDPDDQQLIQRLQDAQFFDASLGIHGLLSNGLFFDVAFPGLIRAQLNPDDFNDTSERTFNYLLGLGYEFDIKNYDMKLIPSVYIQKYRNIPLHVDVNMLLEFLDGKLSGGLLYTLGADNSLGFLIGTKINNIVFNYSYNVSFNPVQSYNNGGHEIGVGLILNGSNKEGDALN